MRYSLVTLLIFTLPLFSQNRLPTPPSAETPSSSRVEPSTAALSDPFLPDIPDPGAIHTPKGTFFEQPAMNGDDIAILYFQLTGKRVLPTQQTSGIELKIVQPGPLTNRDVAEIIETKLIMEGFALQEVPGNTRQLRLVPAAGGPSSIKTLGPRFINDSSQLPNNDEIVTYTMKMNYIDAEVAAGLFQSVIGQFSPAGTISPVPNSRSIVITENALLIKYMLDLKKQIDIPGVNQSTKFITLTYADAEEIAATVEQLINGEEQGSNAPQRRNNQNQNGNINFPVGQNFPSSGGVGLDVTPLRIVPEVRTNRVILSGSPQKMAQAEGLIAELDQPSSKKNTYRRRLKYLPVSDFIPIASNAIEGTLGGDSSAPGSNRPNTNQPGQNNQIGNNNNNNNGTEGGTASVGGQDGSITPESVLIGKTLLVSDNISNSVVVNGPPHHIEIVRNLLDDLDRPSPQIAITTVFGRYGDTESGTFGSELAALFSSDDGSPSFGGGASNVTGVFDATDLSDFANRALNAGLGLGFANSDFGVFLNATKSIGEFQEFARPTVFTTNARAARISSGRRIAVPTGSINNTTGVGSTQIDFRDVTLDLEVRPLVNGDDEITLDISLINDTLGEPRTIDGVEIDDILSEELNTIITIQDKSLIVLGGLYTSREEDSKTKVPVLGDIPLIGSLFSGRSDDTNISELVIMVYARIIKDRNDLNEYQRDYDNNSTIAGETRERFDRNGLLPDNYETRREEKNKEFTPWWKRKKSSPQDENWNTSSKGVLPDPRDPPRAMIKPKGRANF